MGLELHYVSILLQHSRATTTRIQKTTGTKNARRVIYQVQGNTWHVATIHG